MRSLYLNMISLVWKSEKIILMRYNKAQFTYQVQVEDTVVNVLHEKEHLKLACSQQTFACSILTTKTPHIWHFLVQSKQWKHY